MNQNRITATMMSIKRVLLERVRSIPLHASFTLSFKQFSYLIVLKAPSLSIVATTE